MFHKSLSGDWTIEDVSERLGTGMDGSLLQGGGGGEGALEDEVVGRLEDEGREKEDASRVTDFTYSISHNTKVSLLSGLGLLESPHE